MPPSASETYPAAHLAAVQAAYRVAALIEDYPWDAAKGRVEPHWGHIDGLVAAKRLLDELASRLGAVRPDLDEDVRLAGPFTEEE